MALQATTYHLQIALSDVDRNVYESLDLRLARHPSESMRYFLTRVLGYALSYEDGIAFSKGGLSAAEEPPIAIHDPTGILLAWIDVGSPSADRLHKASKAARRVVLYTHHEPALLRKEASARAIHKVEEIEVNRFAPAFLDALESKIDRNTKLELVRTDGVLYVTFPDPRRGGQIEGSVERLSLV
ncbi:MAG: YaeQ family protein [Polyangiales bacterium]